MTSDFNVEELLAAMDAGLRPYLARNPLMIGIHTGGVWLAQSLHNALELTEPMGTLDINFYRDDFTRIGVNPKVRASNLPVDVSDRHVILIDDVLHTGRTTRAAMNIIFDYGRPSSIVLAVLVERDGRELPIQADVVGQSMRLSPTQQIKLSGPDDMSLKVTDKTT